MAGEIETNTGAVEHAGDGPGVEQATTGTSAATVPATASNADESRSTGPATEQGQSLDARLKQLERTVKRMQRVFSNHSHAHEEEPGPAQDMVQSQPEAGAIPAPVPEKPIEQTASHVEEKQRNRSGYFHRAHRIKARVNARH